MDYLADYTASDKQLYASYGTICWVSWFLPRKGTLGYLAWSFGNGIIHENFSYLQRLEYFVKTIVIFRDLNTFLKLLAIFRDEDSSLKFLAFSRDSDTLIKF